MALAQYHLPSRRDFDLSPYVTSQSPLTTSTSSELPDMTPFSNPQLPSISSSMDDLSPGMYSLPGAYSGPDMNVSNISDNSSDNFNNDFFNGHSSRVSSNTSPTTRSTPERTTKKGPQSPITTSGSKPTSKVQKRTLNTLAARRYRQKRVDQVSSLETSLKDTQDERDALKLKVARLEAEVDILRGLVKK
ncbi:uncharacterized protein RSE6_11710 [Rhynchosporium secalis]|uniref:BZIP domain-containing protein n=1 Tax=Rhynchosporium secalis TaxID=38038 RepID=A0A1E1MNM5_RHYSE|nr:uncharacterized protein RSE6_11710 [Rhynchosporium secalis]